MNLAKMLIKILNSENFKKENNFSYNPIEFKKEIDKENEQITINIFSEKIAFVFNKEGTELLYMYNWQE